MEVARARKLIMSTLLAVSVTLVPSVARGATVLRVQDWKLTETGATQKWFQYVKERFEAEHPGVRVSYEPVGFGNEYVQKLIVQAAGQAVPDVVSLSIIWARDLYTQGMLLPLNKYVERNPEVGPKAMIPGTQVYNHYGDVIYGVTNAMDVSALIYDMDALEQAGLDSGPYAIGSWEEFLDYAKKLTKYGNDGKVVRWGFDFWPGSEDFASWLTANGGSFYSNDLKSAGFNNKQGLETLQLYYDLRTRYKVAADSRTGANFMQATAAMGYGGAYSGYWAPHYVPQVKFNMTSFPPGPSGTKRGSVVWGNMYSIPKGAANPDLAWEFIRLYSSREMQIEMFKIMQSVTSPRIDFYQSKEYAEAYRQNMWMRMVPEIYSVGGIYPFLRSSEFDSEAWVKHIDPAIEGRIPLSQGLGEAARILNRLLSEGQ